MKVFEAMTALSSVFMPGGDGGTLDWETIATVATELHKARNSSAGIWVSKTFVCGGFELSIMCYFPFRLPIARYQPKNSQFRQWKISGTTFLLLGRTTRCSSCPDFFLTLSVLHRRNDIAGVVYGPHVRVSVMGIQWQ